MSIDTFKFHLKGNSRENFCSNSILSSFCIGTTQVVNGEKNIESSSSLHEQVVCNLDVRNVVINGDLQEPSCWGHVVATSFFEMCGGHLCVEEERCKLHTEEECGENTAALTKVGEGRLLSIIVMGSSIFMIEWDVTTIR
jgi:hypothetical protein